MKSYSYNQKTFTVPSLSKKNPIVLKIKHDEIALEISKTCNQIFDLKNFSIPRTPIILENFEYLFKNDSFNKDLRVLDMPIKFPNSDVKIPEICKPYLDIISKTLKYEWLANPEFKKYHCYLTIDNSYVERGLTQRNEGCHVDGFQGARIKKKVVSDRSYVLVSDFPTEFYCQKWDVSHLDPAKHNFFKEFDKQAKEEYKYVPEVKNLILMDAYTVHKAGVATENKRRAFVRISFSVRKFDRLGNTHNPLFDYNWKMVKRDVSKVLS